MPLHSHTWATLRSRLADLLERETTSSPSAPAPSRLDAETAAWFEAALARLAAADQAAIFLRLELQLCDEDVAALLDKPTAAAARMSVGRALVRLATAGRSGDDPRLLRLARDVVEGVDVEASISNRGATDAETAAHLEALRRCQSVASHHAGATPRPIGEAPARAGAAEDARGSSPSSIHDDDTLHHPELESPESSLDAATTWAWGHLRVLRKLGDGAFGEVYQAWDTTLHREVALKLLRVSTGSASDMRRLEQQALHEGRNLARLRHPNVVTVFGAEKHADRVGIWMEFVRGQTLEDLLAERGRLDEVEAARVGIEVCRALTAVHRAGLVHRDLKARNVMRDADGRIVLMDFGAGLDIHTTTGGPPVLQGTPVYMAPEALHGEVPTARSDVYSLGVLLYHLASGAFPVSAGSLQEFREAHLEGRVTPFRDACPASNPAFAAVVERALENDPARRFPSAALAEEALADFLRSAGGAGPHRDEAGAAPPGASRRRRAAVLAVVAVALAAAVSAVWFASRRTPPGSGDAQAVAILDFGDATGAADGIQVAGLMSMVHVGLVQSSPCRIVSPELLYDLRRREFDDTHGPIEAGQALELAAKSGATCLLSGQLASTSKGPAITWRLVEVSSGVILGAQHTVSEDLVSLCDRLIADLLPLLARQCRTESPLTSTSVASITTSSPRAFEHYVSGMLALEEQRNNDAVRFLEAAVRLDSTFARAYLALSHAYQPAYEQAQAEAAARRAWALRDRLGIQDRLRLEAHRAELDRRLQDAQSTYREILRRWPDNREALRGLAASLFAYRSFDACAAVTTRGLALYPEDVTLGIYHQTALRNLGRLAEAVGAAKAYIARYPENPNAWDTLGWHYLSLGQPDSARAAFDKALGLDSRFVLSLRGLASCSYARGDLDAAIEATQAIVARQDQPLGWRSWAALDVTQWPGLAALLAEAGRFHDAQAVVDRWAPSVTDVEADTQIEMRRVRLWLDAGQPRRVLDAVRQWSARSATTTTDRLRILAWEFDGLVACDSVAAAVRVLETLRSLRSSWTGVEVYVSRRGQAQIDMLSGRPDAAVDSLLAIRRSGVPAGMIDIEFRSLLAQALERAGRRDEAQATWRELVRIYGGHVRARFELARSLEAAGRGTEARGEYAAFAAAWRRADATHPALVEARARAGAATP